MGGGSEVERLGRMVRRRRRRSGKEEGQGEEMWKNTHVPVFLRFFDTIEPVSTNSTFFSK